MTTKGPVVQLHCGRKVNPAPDESGCRRFNDRPSQTFSDSPLKDRARAFLRRDRLLRQRLRSLHDRTAQPLVSSFSRVRLINVTRNGHLDEMRVPLLPPHWMQAVASRHVQEIYACKPGLVSGVCSTKWPRCFPRTRKIGYPRAQALAGGPRQTTYTPLHVIVFPSSSITTLTERHQHHVNRRNDRERRGW